ncbi:MAG TPA: hypothetical protein VMW65_03090 [Chloroflexota bacterium]|nr:hypothetical protein [Chloroflexota bacterium]
MKSTAPVAADLAALAAGAAVDAAAWVGATVGWLLTGDVGFVVGGAVDGLAEVELDCPAVAAVGWLAGAVGAAEQAASSAPALPANAHTKSERRLTEPSESSNRRELLIIVLRFTHTSLNCHIITRAYSFSNLSVVPRLSFGASPW